MTDSGAVRPEKPRPVGGLRQRSRQRQAVLATTEPNVKAAALYNLGRTEESEAPATAAVACGCIAAGSASATAPLRAT